MRLIVNAGIGFVIGLAFGALNGGPPEGGLQAVMQLFSLGVSIIVGSAIIMAMLPTDYGKALIISLLEVAIVVCVAFAIGIAVFVVVMAMGGLG